MIIFQVRAGLHGQRGWVSVPFWKVWLPNWLTGFVTRIIWGSVESIAELAKPDLHWYDKAVHTDRLPDMSMADSSIFMRLLKDEQPSDLSGLPKDLVPEQVYGIVYIPPSDPQKRRHTSWLKWTSAGEPVKDFGLIEKVYPAGTSVPREPAKEVSPVIEQPKLPELPKEGDRCPKSTCSGYLKLAYASKLLICGTCKLYPEEEPPAARLESLRDFVTGKISKHEPIAFGLMKTLERYEAEEITKLILETPGYQIFRKEGCWKWRKLPVRKLKKGKKAKQRK